MSWELLIEGKIDLYGCPNIVVGIPALRAAFCSTATNRCFTLSGRFRTSFGNMNVGSKVASSLTLVT